MKNQKNRIKKQHPPTGPPPVQTAAINNNESYNNIIKFSLSKEKTEFVEDSVVGQAKKGRRKNFEKAAGAGNNGRKKVKKDSDSSNLKPQQQQHVEMKMNNGYMPGPNQPHQNQVNQVPQYNNMMFAGPPPNMYNPQAMVAPQFNYMNGPMMMAPQQDHQENGGLSFNNSALSNLYAMLQDPNKDIIGLLNSAAVFQDPEILVFI